MSSPEVIPNVESLNIPTENTLDLRKENKQINKNSGNLKNTPATAKTRTDSQLLAIIWEKFTP